MKLAIINCSVRQQNTTRFAADLYLRQAQEQDINSSILTLEAFDTLFTGEYILRETATPAQKDMLDAMIAADALLFVVPTYYKSLPGVAKNFFDIVRCKEAYADKIIGFAASNHKNQDYGARHVQQIVNGLLIFFDIKAVLVPEIVISHPEALDPAETKRMLGILQGYYDRYKA